MHRLCLALSVVGLCSFGSALRAEEPAAPDYSRDVAPLLKKYCVGCHNPTDHEGQLSLESYQDLQKGGEKGPAVLAGDAAGSRLIRLLTGVAEPKMPPEGEAAPTPDEIARLQAWIESGAKGPAGAEPDRLTLITPKVESHAGKSPITAVDAAPQESLLAVAQYEHVVLLPLPADGQAPANLEQGKAIGRFPGKVTAVHFSPDGARLVTASGVTGLGGQAAIWNIADGALVRKFDGHRDILYDAELSPDGAVLATCSYDRNIILWDAASGAQLRTLAGHNGAVYDIAFSPDGQFLVSASADDTCKVWRVADGERMDTLGQPLEEQYSCAFTPDGKSIVAAGADNRIRVWRFISRQKPQINPLKITRFAHEGAVLKLAFTPDGKHLVSIADDRTLKVWETRTFTEVHLGEEPEVAAAVAVAATPPAAVVGRLDGTLGTVSLSAEALTPPQNVAAVQAVEPVQMEREQIEVIEEIEPNNIVGNAQTVDAPVQIAGAIEGIVGGQPDFDTFRFNARAGEEWVIEVIAARSKSKLDSFIEVLTEGGQPVERVLLQAVRDSYFTFRGKNADEVGDFRVFNWEEMDVNDYLYANGEVVKFWMYPRGPDSGFISFPGDGKRWGYFDTTPLAHALGEPCYIVKPHPPGTKLIPNGLPVFTLHYENDDEAQRKLGADSKLYFTAPEDGDYLVRIRDVRGFEGEDYGYRLILRPRRPDFRVSVDGEGLKVSPGSAREFRVVADRLDRFEGPITVNITGLPPGFQVSNPIVIGEGQQDAFGVLWTDADAPTPTPQNQMVTIALGKAEINGQEISHPGKGLGKIELGEAPKLTAKIVAAEKGVRPLPAADEGPLEFVIHPGETIMLKVEVNRSPFKGEVSFGKEKSGRNLPHGVYVDNIGLNGLLLLDEQNEREFYITAAPWVPEQTRFFHLETNDGGKHATPPVLLHVRRVEGDLPKTAAVP